MSISEVLVVGGKTLRDAGIDGATRDARLLLAQALGIGVDRLTIEAEKTVTQSELETFSAMLDRRVAREPVARILGRRAFWGRDFMVTPDVLDPRPETETLIEAALAGGAVERILDLGTGSGILALTLLAEWPEARAVASDISEDALIVCVKNAGKHGLGPRLSVLVSDWYEQIDGVFDLIVSNPPYIAAAEMGDLSEEVRQFDPFIALSPGGDGLEAYRIIAAGAQNRLAPNGRILVEIGHLQGVAVAGIFANAGLEDITVLPDMDGRDRVVAANMPRK
ncbi:MAG: peptide chain release factor N(5)-glutamine methyltransferase [Rhodobacterales bacterium]|nr:peptide chain release factor N(5)-glutamine methyltransferase [Rhodobacterales bacterium]